MDSSKIFYGKTFLELEDLIESKIDYLVELDYYKTNIIKEASTMYGIEVVKTEHFPDKLKKEIRNVKILSENESKVDEILENLKKFKVTPIGLKDTVTEMLKEGIV